MWNIQPKEAMQNWYKDFNFEAVTHNMHSEKKTLNQVGKEAKIKMSFQYKLSLKIQEPTHPDSYVQDCKDLIACNPRHKL